MFGKPSMPTDPQYRYRKENDPEFHRVSNAIFASGRKATAANVEKVIEARQAKDLTDDQIALIRKLVFSGLSVKSIAWKHGLPSQKFLQQRLKVRPECADILRKSADAGYARRRKQHDIGWFDDIIGQIRAGGSIRKICDKPGYPTSGWLYEWLKRNPAEASRHNEALQFAAKQGLVGGMRRWRPADFEATIGLVEQFWTVPLGDIVAGQELPTFRSLQYAAHKHTELAARLGGALAVRRTKTVEAFKVRREQKAALRVLRAQGKRRGGHLGQKRPDGQLGQLLAKEDAYRIADAHIPRHLPRDVRDDIKSDIVEAVLSGEITVDEIAIEARYFVSDHFRRSDTYRSLSLDAKLSKDGDATFGDKLTDHDASMFG